MFINRGLLYYQLNNYSNALKDLSLAAQYEPDDLNIQHMIGVCLRKLDKFNEAVEVLSNIYAISGNFHDALISRGNTFVDFGTEEAFEKAQRDYEMVLSRDPSNLDAHINLAYLFQMTGKFKRAWEQFTSADKITKSKLWSSVNRLAGRQWHLEKILVLGLSIRYTSNPIPNACTF